MTAVVMPFYNTKTPAPHPCKIGCRPFLTIYPSVVIDLPKGLLLECATGLSAAPTQFRGQACRLTVRLEECLLPTPARRNEGPGVNSTYSLLIR